MPVLAIAGLALAPVLSLCLLAVSGSWSSWPHLLANVLPTALRDTALLMGGVAIVVSILGVSTAWITATLDFRGRRTLEWALLLPLAVPTYIVAYTYVELLDAFGPAQTAFRALTGYASRRDYWFPEPRSLTGAILLFGFVLYPYVYLTTRAVFLMQSSCVLDVARTLGGTRRGVFAAIALPLARPAVVVGVTLALLETLNDLGAVEYFGVRTLTVTMYTTWLNQNDLAAAAQIALLVLGVVLGLLAIERYGRRHQRFAAQAQRARRLGSRPVRGRKALLAFSICFLPVLVGFLLPASFLAVQAVRRTFVSGLPTGFLLALWHTVLIAGLVAVLAVGCGVLVALSLRLARQRSVPFVARLSGVGYAVPGTVLAIGLLLPLAALDNAIASAVRSLSGVSPGLLLSGSVFALVLALTIRFVAIASGGIEAGLSKISPHLDMAARALGRTRGETLREVHLPLARPALMAAALLVFVDAMKELPATLLLRPFGFDTLATLVYEEASRGSFESGALAALAIVVAGLGPVILMARLSRPALPDLAGRSESAR